MLFKFTGLPVDSDAKELQQHQHEPSQNINNGFAPTFLSTESPARRIKSYFFAEYIARSNGRYFSA